MAAVNYSLSERVFEKLEVLPIYANLRSIFGPKLSGHINHVLGIGLAALLRWEFAFDFDFKVAFTGGFGEKGDSGFSADF